MAYSDNENKAYWEEYYKKIREESRLKAPSDFAVWASQFLDDCCVVEIGCGNGRDAFHFAKQGIRVAAFDYAESAISINNKLASEMDYNNHLKFQRLNVSDIEELNNAVHLIKNHTYKNLCLYSRFFFHAIDEKTEDNALSFISNNLSGNGNFAMFEFRTDKDVDRSKETQFHYRRYICPDNFISKANERFNMECIYRIEGTGMAIYGKDDAYVARLIFIDKYTDETARLKICEKIKKYCK